LAALRRAYQKARGQGAEEVLAAGTMALRIATNADEFLADAERQGTPVRVLSGEDEAALGLQAVVRDPALGGSPRVTVMDVGGHSTEITTAVEGSAVFLRSFPVGALGLREGPLADESPDPPAVLRAGRLIDDALGFRYLPGQAGTAVTLGATGTNLVTIRDGIAEWDAARVHAQILSYGQVSRSVSRLMALTDLERRSLVGMEPGREKTLHIGALILERCMYAVGIEECTVSTRGWRHALLERGWI
jgi:exopolyphosphatase/guanosine-5'-triphosphate,3'-diphosphate pyrophosphatase